MSRSSRTKASIGLFAMALLLPACRKSPTTKQIKGFADKVCACKDAACAEAVQAEYLEWWKGNMRARGSEGDRKGVEKAMQRYAECHLALVGPKTVAAPPAAPVPKVNLQRPMPTPEPASVAPGTREVAPSKATSETVDQAATPPVPAKSPAP